MQENQMRVGVIYWNPGEGMSSVISDAVEGLGHEAISLFPDERFPLSIDAVFAYGPLGSVSPLINQILDRPPDQRPVFILWVSESLPNPDRPEWFRWLGGELRSRVERLAYRRRDGGTWRLAPGLGWMTSKAFRYRYYGDLYWIRRADLPFVLAIPSDWIADFLRARGFDPVTAYYGSAPAWGGDLKLDRDIPLLWLGKIGTARRKRILGQVRAELEARGVEMMVVDGVEHPYVFGEERTRLLNRTKIILNVSRESWEDSSLRYFIVAPNKAMIITEPTLPHTPFADGIHLIESPVEEMANTICHYLDHEEERKAIAEQAYRLVTEELTMKRSVEKILERVPRRRS